MCLNFRLNYLGEIKWRDWVIIVLFDRVWILGDFCFWFILWSVVVDEDCSVVWGMIFVIFIKILLICKFWVLFYCLK